MYRILEMKLFPRKVSQPFTPWWKQWCSNYCYVLRDTGFKALPLPFSIHFFLFHVFFFVVVGLSSDGLKKLLVEGDGMESNPSHTQSEKKDI